MFIGADDDDNLPDYGPAWKRHFGVSQLVIHHKYKVRYSVINHKYKVRYLVIHHKYKVRYMVIHHKFKVRQRFLQILDLQKNVFL